MDGRPTGVCCRLPEDGEDEDGQDEGDEGGGVASRVNLLVVGKVRRLQTERKDGAASGSSADLRERKKGRKDGVVSGLYLQLRGLVLGELAGLLVGRVQLGPAVLGAVPGDVGCKRVKMADYLHSSTQRQTPNAPSILPASINSSWNLFQRICALLHPPEGRRRPSEMVRSSPTVAWGRIRGRDATKVGRSSAVLRSPAGG